jgi:hypothetical protein
MLDRRQRCSRRKFLASAAALTLAGAPGPTPADTPAAPPRDLPLSRTRPAKLPLAGRKPLAVVTTVYRPLSHAYHIAGRFVHGYARAGRLHVPAHYVHSLYVDQKPDNDLSADLARDFGVRLGRSVADTLLEGDRLAVDGVLLIGEHGNYPRNDRGQILYPRFEMMGQIAAAFRKAGRSVPVFNDKHLSYTFERARTMLGWAAELKFPMLAGSSLPVTWRSPEYEPRPQTPFEAGLVACYGPIEVYGFHALEALQVMLERRRGGETGVRAVTCLSGKEVWQAGDQGRWSWDLLEAALARSESVNPGDVRVNTGSMGVQRMPPVPATAFLIEYRDGTRGTVLLLNGHVWDFTFAGKVRGDTPARRASEGIDTRGASEGIDTRPASCLFRLPPPPGARFFDALAGPLEKFFEEKQPPYPVERTLLTTGILDAALRSHELRGARVETPELDVRYAAPADSGFARGAVADW